ncbi:hypothetical protein GCM10010987_33500 [Bradyrhizobium guangdongense]|uniref:Uncharacterized protein n=1 Tax=Bradyrhizobium guangdongense TaxID=1325090 RepID=A0AA87W4E5_9BRAD|nr:hypothetical protein GCM10010987_33500 [Bradyrhizobium guangdongense]
MWQPDVATQRARQRVEPEAEQHPREYQEQGGGKVPGEDQGPGEEHDSDAADGNGPSQVSRHISSGVPGRI